MPELPEVETIKIGLQKYLVGKRIENVEIKAQKIFEGAAPAGSAAPMIGFAVAGLIVLGGPISGASMNPFRSLAPALFAGGAAMQALPVYVFAPLFGMIAAALVYEGLRVRL